MEGAVSVLKYYFQFHFHTSISPLISFGNKVITEPELIYIFSLTNLREKEKWQNQSIKFICS